MTDDRLIKRTRAALSYLGKNWTTPLVDAVTAAKLLRARPGTLRMRVWRGALEVHRENTDNGATNVSFTGQQLTYALLADRCSRWNLELSNREVLRSLDLLCNQIYENILDDPYHIDACVFFTRNVNSDGQMVISCHVSPEGMIPSEHIIESVLIIPIGRLMLRLAIELQVHRAGDDPDAMDEVVRLH